VLSIFIIMLGVSRFLALHVYPQFVSGFDVDVYEILNVMLVAPAKGSVEVWPPGVVACGVVEGCVIEVDEGLGEVFDDGRPVLFGFRGLLFRNTTAATTATTTMMTTTSATSNSLREFFFGVDGGGGGGRGWFVSIVFLMIKITTYRSDFALKRLSVYLNN
jgi:hypothetical protein